MNTGHINIGGTSRLDITCDKPEEDEEEVDGYGKWLYHQTSRSRRIDKVINDIKNGKAISVSDGSYYSDTRTGAAAWIIESEDATQFIRGESIVPGAKEIQSAYRSEVTGLLAIIDKLQLLSTEYNITEGAIVIACDGITALTRLTNG